jgi:hypothetical protein
MGRRCRAANRPGRDTDTCQGREAQTFGDLIDLHIADMKDVGKAPGRSKDATLAMLNRRLGSRNMVELDRERILTFGRPRALAR